MTFCQWGSEVRARPPSHHNRTPAPGPRTPTYAVAAPSVTSSETEATTATGSVRTDFRTATRMPINSLVQGGRGTDLRLLHLAEDHRVLARELLDVVLRELLGRRADVRLAALLGLEEDLFRLLDLDVLDDV